MAEMPFDEKSLLVWWNKNRCYETPYAIKGGIKLTGSEQKPKDVCTDKIIGTRKGIEFPQGNRLTKPARDISNRIGAEKRSSNR
jgi:hypothetical protein